MLYRPVMINYVKVNHTREETHRLLANLHEKTIYCRGTVTANRKNLLELLPDNDLVAGKSD